MIVNSNDIPEHIRQYFEPVGGGNGVGRNPHPT
jgi:hypothetical protein